MDEIELQHPDRDDPPENERSDSWDTASPGVLAFRLEQARLRYTDLLSELRSANRRAALLLAAALIATPLLVALAFAVPVAPLGDSVALLLGVAGTWVLGLVFLLGALLDLLRALTFEPPAAPYRLDELGTPERYLTPGDRNRFASSIGVLQYRQIQRLRPAVRELEGELGARNRRLRRGLEQLITALLLIIVPTFTLLLVPVVLPA